MRVCRLEVQSNDGWKEDGFRVRITRCAAQNIRDFAIDFGWYAHIGRPTIRAIDSGKRAAFGEVGSEGGDVYVVTKKSISKRKR